MVPYVEVIGPDRAGKTSLIYKIWDSLGSRKFSYSFYEDRGFVDAIVMDDVFGRTDDRSKRKRIELAKMLGDSRLFALVYLHAPVEVLESRQKYEEPESERDVKYFNKVKVDQAKSLEAYDRIYSELHPFIKLSYDFDTSEMSTDDIFKEMTARGLVL